MEQTETSVTTEKPMYLTREFLESRLIENEARIKQLEEHIQKVTNAHTARLQNAIVCVMKCKTGPWSR